MIKVSRSALVLHPASAMYDLVNDVHRYPEFLPWCDATEVHQASTTSMVATLQLSRAGIKQRLTTENCLVQDQSIQLQLKDGPFEHFQGLWLFTPLREDACKIAFDLEFKVNNRLAGIALEKVFTQVANTMVDAFCQRAGVIHGR